MADVPGRLTPEVYDAHLKTRAKEAVEEWEAKAASFRGIFKRLLGRKAVEQGEDYLKDVAKDMAKGAAFGVAALATGWPGLAVGFVFLAGYATYDELTAAWQGPHRYLSRLRSAGAAVKDHVTVMAPPAAVMA